MQLFAKTDAQFMQMFTGACVGHCGVCERDVRTSAAADACVCSHVCCVFAAAAAGALAALQGKRDSLHRRCEGLIKCKNEFAELARAL